MKAGSIRITPLAYLRGLVTRAGTGNFTPEVALQVADSRKRRRQNEAVLRQAEAAHREVLKNEGTTRPCMPVTVRWCAGLPPFATGRAAAAGAVNDGAAFVALCHVAGRLAMGLSGARSRRSAAGTPALREAVAPPSAGFALLGHRAVGAANVTQRTFALRDAPKHRAHGHGLMAGEERTAQLATVRNVRRISRRRRHAHSRLDRYRYRAEIEALAEARASSYDIALWLRKFKRTKVHPTTVWRALKRWRDPRS